MENSEQNFSPFTSRGYPFSKTLDSYDSTTLGRAFFSDGFTESRGSLRVFDNENLLGSPRVADESLYLKKAVIPVTVYSAVSEEAVSADYKKLTLDDNEIAVLIVKNSALITGQPGMSALVQMGGSIQKLSNLDKEQLRAKRFELTDVDMKKLEKGLSAKTIIELLNKNNALFSVEEAITGPAAKPKPKMHFTIGMFFDGTANNRYNSDAVYYRNLVEHKEHGIIVDESNFKDAEKVKVIDKQTKKSSVIDVPTDSSYWNPYSNVSLLHDLYPVDKTLKPGKDGSVNVTLRQYVQGIGTLRIMEDDILGSAIAEGPWGIIGKVQDGCADVAAQIKAMVGNKYQIGSLTFDVFGFSRGAAAARHFCNEILGEDSLEEFTYRSIENLQDKYEELLRADYPHTKIAVTTKDINNLHYYRYSLGMLGDALSEKNDGGKGLAFTLEKAVIGDLSASAVKIRFLGIFDTVVSQMLVKENLGKKLGGAISVLTRSPMPLVASLFIKKAKQEVKKLGIERIFHITADDEIRANFALTKVNEGVNFPMNGAHSDIGGGYAAIPFEKNILDFFTLDKNEGIPGDRTKVRNYYLGKGYGTGTEIKHETASTEITSYYIPPGYVYTDVDILKHLVSRRKVTPRYSAVSLHVMMNVARDCRVPFRSPDIPEVKNYKFEYEIPPKLEKYGKLVTEYAKQSMKYVYKISKAKPKDPVPQDLKSLILHSFVHLSSNYNKSLLFNKKGERVLGIRTGINSIDKIGYANYPRDSYSRENLPS